MKIEDILSGIRHVYNGDIVVFTCRLWFSPAEGLRADAAWEASLKIVESKRRIADRFLNRLVAAQADPKAAFKQK